MADESGRPPEGQGHGSWPPQQGGWGGQQPPQQGGGGGLWGSGGQPPQGGQTPGWGQQQPPAPQTPPWGRQAPGGGAPPPIPTPPTAPGWGQQGPPGGPQTPGWGQGPGTGPGPGFGHPGGGPGYLGGPPGGKPPRKGMSSGAKAAIAVACGFVFLLLVGGVVGIVLATRDDDEPTIITQEPTATPTPFETPVPTDTTAPDPDATPNIADADQTIRVADTELMEEGLQALNDEKGDVGVRSVFVIRGYVTFEIEGEGGETEGFSYSDFGRELEPSSSGSFSTDEENESIPLSEISDGLGAEVLRTIKEETGAELTTLALEVDKFTDKRSWRSLVDDSGSVDDGLWYTDFDGTNPRDEP